ncbi:MAG: hypothetical protein TUN42_02030 [Dehalogenimonas sp.]
MIYTAQHQSNWSWGGAAKAAVTGAIVGAIGSIAGPAAGSVLNSFGKVASGVLADIGTGTINAVGGVAASYFGEGAETLVNNSLGIEDSFSMPFSEVAVSAISAGIGGVVGNHAFPTHGVNTLEQEYLLPQKASQIFDPGVNACQLYRGGTVATFVGAGVQELISPQGFDDRVARFINNGGRGGL